MRVPKEVVDEVLLYHKLDYGEAEIRQVISNHKLVFMYLVGQGGARGAFETLYWSLKRGDDPNRFLERDFSMGPLFEAFYGTSRLPIRERRPIDSLPEWFRAEVKTNLTIGFRTHYSLEAYWVTARLLTDSLFFDAVALARKRWKTYGSARRWYRKMDAAQSAALAFLSSQGVIVGVGPGGQQAIRIEGGPAVSSQSVLVSQDSPRLTFIYGRGSPPEARTSTPFDDRDADTYREGRHAFDGYGLPIADYDADLAALAHLAGGSASDPVWRSWAESWVWDFKELPFIQSKREAGHWSEARRINSRLALAGLRRHRDGMLHQEGRVRCMPEPYGVLDTGVGPGVFLRSRWLRLQDFPPSVQGRLVYLIVQRWGDFDELPTEGNMVRALESYTAPLSADEVRKADVEGELEQLGAAERRLYAAARQRRRRLRSTTSA